MTPANVRAAADWINSKTEWRANNWAGDHPSWATAGAWSTHRLKAFDETWDLLTHAELIEFAKKLGFVPEPDDTEAETASEHINKNTGWGCRFGLDLEREGRKDERLFLKTRGTVDPRERFLTHAEITEVAKKLGWDKPEVDDASA